MQSVKMYNLKKTVFLLCITSGLTLSVNNESKTDGASKNVSLNLNKSNISSTTIQTKFNQVMSTTVPSTDGKDPKVKDIVHLLQTEGGPISNSLSVQSLKPNQNATTISDSSVVGKNMPTEKSVSQTTIRNEATSSRVLDRKRGHLMPDQTAFNDEKQSIEMHVVVTDNNDNVHTSKGQNDTKTSDKSIQLNNTSDILSIPNLLEKKLQDSSNTTMPLLSKHKPNPKPTVTMGGGAADPNKPIPPSPTKSSPLGMPRKIDYIIPIAITVLALPILGITSFILYNRGKDCWDKRHYRRMDFLIDGMYND